MLEGRVASRAGPLVETPAPTADGRGLSVWDVYFGISGGLYYEKKWPDVISALTALEAGNTAGMLALATPSTPAQRTAFTAWTSTRTSLCAAWARPV